MVREVRAALPEAAVAAIERVSSVVPEAYDFLAVDVLDAMLTYSDAVAADQYLLALRRFAARGAREWQRAEVIFRDLDGHSGVRGLGEPNVH